MRGQGRTSIFALQTFRVPMCLICVVGSYLLRCLCTLDKRHGHLLLSRTGESLMTAIDELERVKQGIESQIQSLRAELDAIDKAISVLKREQTRPSTLGRSAEDFSKMGLSDACRKIVGEEFISPVIVRDRLRAGAYPNQDKGKLLGSVYATVKRLAESGEFEAQKVEGEPTKYRKRPQGGSALG